jgi:hypothetical protein
MRQKKIFFWIGIIIFFLFSAVLGVNGEGFDIYLMGIVSETHYDENPPFIKMKVIEGALNRVGKEVAVIIPEEGLTHWKRRIKVGMELDTRLRVLEDGRYEMAVAQLRSLPSRDFKGQPSIEDTVRKNTTK